MIQQQKQQPQSDEGKTHLGVLLPDSLHDAIDQAILDRNKREGRRGRRRFCKHHAVAEALKLWLGHEGEKRQAAE